MPLDNLPSRSNFELACNSLSTRCHTLYRYRTISIEQLSIQVEHHPCKTNRILFAWIICSRLRKYFFIFSALTNFAWQYYLKYFIVGRNVFSTFQEESECTGSEGQISRGNVSTSHLSRHGVLSPRLQSRFCLASYSVIAQTKPLNKSGSYP